MVCTGSVKRLVGGIGPLAAVRCARPGAEKAAPAAAAALPGENVRTGDVVRTPPHFCLPPAAGAAARFARSGALHPDIETPDFDACIIRAPAATLNNNNNNNNNNTRRFVLLAASSWKL
ncbi:hypothetical protein DIPPA_33655 [Diplonema papillatum]|nr:hypothetical protein DIPPA_33655 [Diplonema papillatum]